MIDITNDHVCLLLMCSQVKLRSDLELRDFHEQVQDQLGLFVANCRNRRRRDIERYALLARLEADSQLLLGIH